MVKRFTSGCEISFGQFFAYIKIISFFPPRHPIHVAIAAATH